MPRANRSYLGQWGLEGEWGSDVALISMKNCRNKANDSALESRPLAKLISIKFLSVVEHLGGWGVDVTTRPYLGLWDLAGVGFRCSSDLNEKLS